MPQHQIAVATKKCLGVGARHRRLPAAEARLAGQPARVGLGEALRPEDFAALSPIDDLRASADYRREAALTLTHRAVDLCLTGEPGGAI